jgi:hypothetical protein
VTKEPRSSVPTRVGDVAIEVYRPAGGTGRSILLIPGIHSMGIEEPRLKGLADDLAATGYTIVTSALPDLQGYTITQRSADVIEDLVAALSARQDLTRDGRIGSGGHQLCRRSLAGRGRTSADSRPRGLRAVLRRARRPAASDALPATGRGDRRARVSRSHPPHDYGVAVILYALAGRGVVPADQVEALRDGVRTFLLRRS